MAPEVLAAWGVEGCTRAGLYITYMYIYIVVAICINLCIIELL